MREPDAGEREEVVLDLGLGRIGRGLQRREERRVQLHDRGGDGGPHQAQARPFPWPSSSRTRVDVDVLDRACRAWRAAARAPSVPRKHFGSPMEVFRQDHVVDPPGSWSFNGRVAEGAGLHRRRDAATRSQSPRRPCRRPGGTPSPRKPLEDHLASLTHALEELGFRIDDQLIEGFLDLGHLARAWRRSPRCGIFPSAPSPSVSGCATPNDPW